MTFAQRVMTGNVKLAVNYAALGRGLVNVGSKLWGGARAGAAAAETVGSKALGGARAVVASKPFQVATHPLAVSGATVGLNALNNAIATHPAALAQDVATMSKSYDNNIRPLIGAGLLLGAPVAGYVASRKTETDDEP